MSPLQVFAPDGAPPLSNREAAALYLEAKQLEVLSNVYTARSLDRCRFYLESFLSHHLQDGLAVGEQPAGTGRQQDLRHWLLANAQWQATATRNDAIGQVIACFRWLESEGLCRCPYRRMYVGPPPRPRSAMSWDEYKAMLHGAKEFRTATGRPLALAEQFRAMLIFLRKTGARTNEAREARFDQIDWINGLLILEQHKTARKTGKPRLIPIARVRRLLRWLQRRRKSGQQTIFANAWGKPLTKSVVTKLFRRVRKAAGVRECVSAYSARHALVSNLKRNLEADQAIADAVGHSGTHYVGWYGQDVAEDAKHLNAVLRHDRRRRK